MALGQQLKQQRLAHHLSQTQLAAELHLSRQSISKWENGTALPSFANVVAISDLFGLTLDELIKEDHTLMAHLEKSSTITPVTKILFASISIGIIGLISLGQAHISMTTAENWLIPITLIGLIGLICSINWHTFNQALNKWAITWGIIWLSALAIPAIYDVIQGFKAGLTSYNH